MALDAVAWAAYFGVLCGVLWRAIFPYLKAKAEAEKAGLDIKFEVKYLYSMAISFVITVITVMMAIEALVLPGSEVGILPAFLAAFTFGMVFHSAANKVVELMLA